jgi:hypothetical protein
MSYIRQVALGTGRAAVGHVHPKYRSGPEPRRWHGRRRRDRAGAWWLLAFAVVATGYGMVTDPGATLTTWRVIICLTLVWAFYAFVHRTRKWSLRRRYLYPLGEALASWLGDPRYSTETDQLVRLPYEPNNQATTIYLPQTFTPTEARERALVRLVGSKLGLNQPGYTLNLEGERPYLEVRPAPAPPEIVRFSDPKVRALVEAATPERPFLGLGAKSKATYIDWELDSPHALGSQGSGAGKSVTGRAIAAQTVHHGGRVIIIDSVKHGASHKWAKGLPGVEIHRQPATAHQALLDLADEVERRCERDWHGHDTGAQRILLLIEESNATRRQLQSYWVNELEGKKTSPAVNAIADILCVGRQARVNVFAVGQLMTAAASGGNDARENYGIKIMSRFSRNAARMLVPEIDPQPRSSRHLGRAQVCIAGEAHETQIVLFTDDEARAWATESVTVAAPSPAETVPQEVPQLRVVTDDEVPGERLSAISELLGVQVKTLTNARDRDPDFPEAIGVGSRGAKLYDFDAVNRWFLNRARAEA